jgi:cytidylate kinase
MSIITINRGSYSRGKEVAEKLAARLGYACLSRDILLEASKEFNIPEIKLVRALHDAPSVLERFRHGKERYISYLQSALLQHAKDDNLVYHGLAGQFFLADIPHAFKVRIIADIEDRVAEEMRRENISADEALYILQKDDDERRKWGMRVYGTDIWDSRLYDMVIHIKTLTVEDVVDILFDTVQKPIFQTTAQSRQQVDNLALASKVKAVLAQTYPQTQVTADRGSLQIMAPGTEELAQIKDLALGIEGVGKVSFSHLPPR